MDSKIKMLEDLLKEGVIDENEFEEKKNQILSSDKVSNENIKILDDLYKSGVLSQEEYTTKKAAILNPTNMQSINDLKTLLEEGVITKEEYSEKERKLLAQTQTIVQESSTDSKMKFDKKMIAICVAVALAFGGLGYAIGFSSVSETDTTDTEESDYDYERDVRLRNSLSAVEDFYLDHAVVVVNNGSYYHRYGCPDTPMGDGSGDSYEYLLYNIDNAQNLGYKKCSICFGMGSDNYILNYVQ